MTRIDEKELELFGDFEVDPFNVLATTENGLPSLLELVKAYNTVVSRCEELEKENRRIKNILFLAGRHPGQSVEAPATPVFAPPVIETPFDAAWRAAVEAMPIGNLIPPPHPVADMDPDDVTLNGERF